MEALITISKSEGENKTGDDSAFQRIPDRPTLSVKDRRTDCFYKEHQTGCDLYG